MTDSQMCTPSLSADEIDIFYSGLMTMLPIKDILRESAGQISWVFEKNPEIQHMFEKSYAEEIALHNQKLLEIKSKIEKYVMSLEDVLGKSLIKILNSYHSHSYNTIISNLDKHIDNFSEKVVFYEIDACHDIYGYGSYSKWIRENSASCWRTFSFSGVIYTLEQFEKYKRIATELTNLGFVTRYVTMWYTPSAGPKRNPAIVGNIYKIADSKFEMEVKCDVTSGSDYDSCDGDSDSGSCYGDGIVRRFYLF
jgi:hypothetical protein